MESHTPKREAIEKFVASHSGHAPGWQVRVSDEQETPLVRLEAKQGGGDARGLEIHTRQVTLTADRLDESTQKMIERWLDSLVSSGSKGNSN
jgi:hypothetical protein